jgi:hypothetical protein
MLPQDNMDGNGTPDSGSQEGSKTHSLPEEHRRTRTTVSTQISIPYVGIDCKLSQAVQQHFRPFHSIISPIRAPMVTASVRLVALSLAKIELM